MKKFAFPLDRVLDWRAAQVRIEQAKLDQLIAELKRVDLRLATLRDERARSEQQLLGESETSGFSLAALDTFRRFEDSERTRLVAKRRDWQKRIAAQIHTIAAKRRDVRLLERMRERRFSAWQTEQNREQDRQAEEAYMARWPRG